MIFDFINNINETRKNFIDYDKISGRTESEKSLYSGNWLLRSSDKDNWKNITKETSKGVMILSKRHVLVFKADVEDYGTYKVTVKINSDENEIEELSIFTGRRNLVKRNISVKPYSSYSISFYTRITPYIPALSYEPIASKEVFVSILGQNAILASIEIVKEASPAIFIAGDSTLTDQNALFPYYPICSCGGWAQNLLSQVKNIAVCNYAHSGLTTNCFRDDGHYDILKAHITNGDFIIFQFGHNDQKRRNLSPYKGYKENLIWYINETKKMGALPIICSPISRIPITDENETYSLLLDYAKACEEAANECHVPFIDLHSYTFDKWKSIGENIHDYFIPGDITHTNDYGASLISEYVAAELLNIPELMDYISINSHPEFNPENDTKTYPVEENSSSPFDIDMPFLDTNEVSNYTECANAFKKGLMDPCVMHIHPMSPMPRAQLLMLLLRALRLNGTRPYVGTFLDISKYEWDSSYIQTCINENMIDSTTVTETSFRPDDNLTASEFASFCIRGLEENKETRKSLSLKNCYDKALQLELFSNDININDFISRENVYIGLARLMNISNNKNLAMPNDTEMHPVH